jgi:hypothetical protein
MGAAQGERAPGSEGTAQGRARAPVEGYRVALDPERIRKLMTEAEKSGRQCMGVSEARSALNALAVVVGESPRRQLSETVVRMTKAS